MLLGTSGFPIADVIGTFHTIASERKYVVIGFAAFRWVLVLELAIPGVFGHFFQQLGPAFGDGLDGRFGDEGGQSLFVGRRLQITRFVDFELSGDVFDI